MKNLEPESSDIDSDVDVTTAIQTHMIVEEKEEQTPKKDPSYPQRGDLSDLDENVLNHIYEKAREQDLKYARVFGKIVRIPVQPLGTEPDYREMMEFKRECNEQFKEIMENPFFIHDESTLALTVRWNYSPKRILGLRFWMLNFEEITFGVPQLK